jgi:hypothetical protein
MSIVRPHFAEEQFVGFEDLVAEQAHRDEAARRHGIGHHRWGVVAGLALAARPGGFTVEPGYAVDGYGRRLIVADLIDVDVDVDEASSWSRDVWLRLSERAAGDAVTSVCVVPSGAVDPRCPPGVPAPAYDVAPHNGAPPSGASWPVYLGWVTWDGKEVTAGDDRRVSAGLTGESVRAPSGRASLQVGAESAGDPRRFAVLTEVAPPPTDDDTPEPLTPSPQLVVNHEGDLEVYGTSDLNGDVKVIPSAHLPGEAHAGVEFGSATLPKAASPWTVYRTQIERDGRKANQLRVEIAHPGDDGDPARNRFVLGVIDQNASTPAFMPCLAVDANGKVNVHNDLEVEGLLVEGAIDADPTDPRFAAATAESFVQGSVGGANQADAFYAAEVTVTVTSEQAPFQGTTFAYKVSVEAGAAALTNGQVHVVIAIGGSQVQTTQPLNGAPFAAGSTRELALTFQVPGGTSGQALIVSAMALAIGPASNVVSDSGALERTIMQHQIG